MRHVNPVSSYETSQQLREADRLLAEGADVDAVCRQLEISIQTYQRWRSQYKAIRPEDVDRLKQPEKENARLKRLLAEKEPDNDMLLSTWTRSRSRSATSRSCARRPSTSRSASRSTENATASVSGSIRAKAAASGTAC
jgi:putative transposase